MLSALRGRKDTDGVCCTCNAVNPKSVVSEPESFIFVNVSSCTPRSHKPNEKHLRFSIDEGAAYRSRNPHTEHSDRLYCATIRAQEPERQRGADPPPKKAAALPRIINSSRSNVFMHVQSDLFHPQPKARWQRSLAESPLSSTGSLRASQAKWGRRLKDQSGSRTAGVNISLAALAFNTKTNAQMLQFTIPIRTRLQLHLFFVGLDNKQH